MSESLPMPRGARAAEVLRAAAEALDRGERVVLASVVARRGSTPSTPGQKMALFEDGAALGSIGGGAVERSVLAAMAKMLADAASAARVETFRLGPSLGMCCGGSVDVLVEPLSGATPVLVVGAGHVGAALAPLLATLGFRVTVCDSREEAADPARFGGAALRVLHADHDDPAVLEGLGPLSAAALVVVTHDHQLDQSAIEHGLARGFGFVGGVGSRAKAVRTRARLEAKGFSAADIARVRMPLGVEIGARSPAEIAVAVAAELVALRAGVHPGRLSLAGAGEASPHRSAAGAQSTAVDESAGDGGEAIEAGAAGARGAGEGAGGGEHA
jgi:xanthine dehydrogenase accessory factor